MRYAVMRPPCLVLAAHAGAAAAGGRSASTYDALRSTCGRVLRRRGAGCGSSGGSHTAGHRDSSPPRQVLIETVVIASIAAAADASALHLNGTAVAAGRTLRVAFFSALLNQPIRRWWRATLDTAVGASGDGSLPPGVCTLRTLVDRGVYVPLMLSLFFAFMRLSEGAPHELVPCLREKLLPCVLANCECHSASGWLRVKVGCAAAD